MQSDGKGSNWVKKEIEASPANFGGRLLVPLRTIIEVFGGDIRWDSNTETVSIGITIPDETKERSFTIENEEPEGSSNSAKATTDSSQRQNSNDGQPYDKDGTLVKVGYTVNNDIVAGLVKAVQGSKVQVYWQRTVTTDAYNNNNGSEELWGIFAKTPLQTTTWVDASLVRVESFGN